MVHRLLRAAQRVAVQPSDYGDRLNAAIEGWFSYIRGGRCWDLSVAGKAAIEAAVQAEKANQRAWAA
jgi:hypothetical protein